MDISALNAVRDAQDRDYQKYLNELNQHNTDRSFNYGKLLDEINNQSAKRSEELTKAELGASVGDYSYLEKLGIKPDTESAAAASQYERELELAKEAAKYGDYSYLNKLLGGGFTPTESEGVVVDVPGVDWNSFDADLEHAKQRDEREGTTKYTDAVYKKLDEGYYGSTTQQKTPEGTGPANQPTSVKEAGGESAA